MPSFAIKNSFSLVVIVCARFVPHKLTDYKKSLRIQYCKDLSKESKKDPNFKYSIVTGDKTWCFQYDPESKRQSAEWKHPTEPKPKKVVLGSQKSYEIMPTSGAAMRSGRVRAKKEGSQKKQKILAALKMTAVMSNKGDCIDGSLPNEFLSTGRTGRRNAMPDILDPPVAGNTAAGLPERMQMLSTEDEPQAGPSNSNIQPSSSKDGHPQTDNNGGSTS